MSQSDYIKYKRVAIELKSQSKLPAVISSGQYIDYYRFSLANQIFDTSPTFGSEPPANVVSIFGIQRDPQQCSTFAICNNTDSRVNRKPLMGIQIDSLPIKPKPAHITLADLNYCKRKCLNPPV